MLQHANRFLNVNLFKKADKLEKFYGIQRYNYKDERYFNIFNIVIS